MKAKRMLSIILAALMVASMGSVAFAEGPQNGSEGNEIMWLDNTSDYYTMDDGILRRADPNEDFKPGDTIYVSTSYDQNAKANDLKKTKVYVDWILGDKYVDKSDIEIVYKKAQGTTTSYTYKTKNDIYGQKFTVTSDTSLSDDAVKEKLIAQIKASSGYTNAVAAEAAKLITKVYVSGTIEAADKTAAIANWKAANPGWNEEHYTVGGKTFTLAEVDDAMEAYGAVKKTDGYSKGDVYYADADAAMKAEKYTQISAPVYVIGVKAYTEDGLLAEIVKRVETKIIVESENEGAKVVESSGVERDTTGFTVQVDPTSDKYWYSTEDQANTAAKVASGVTAYTEGYYKVDGTSPIDHVTTDAAAAKLTGVLGMTAVNSDIYVMRDNNAIVTTSVLTKTPAVIESEIIDKFETKYRVAGNSDLLSETDANAKAKESATTTVNNQVNTAAANFDKLSSTSATGYRYFVAIPTEKSTTTRVLDVVGDMGVGKTASSAKKNKDFNLQVGLTNGKYDGGTASDDVEIEKPDSASVVKFDDDADEITITWGDEAARFEVNVAGQGDLNLRYSIKYNRDFADLYESANVDFLNFVANPSFNRTGTLYIYADEDSYLYEVTEDGAKKVNGAKYDDDEGAWVLRTRKLGSYAISDKKLKTIDQMTSSSSSNSSSNNGGSTSKPTDGNSSGGKYNPNTGR